MIHFQWLYQGNPLMLSPSQNFTTKFDDNILDGVKWCPRRISDNGDCRSKPEPLLHTFNTNWWALKRVPPSLISFFFNYSSCLIQPNYDFSIIARFLSSIVLSSISIPWELVDRASTSAGWLYSTHPSNVLILNLSLFLLIITTDTTWCILLHSVYW